MKSMCRHCHGITPGGDLGKHVYVIVKRRGESRKGFCSLLCVEGYVAQRYPDYEPKAEQYSSVHGKPCLHQVTIGRKNNRYAHRDAGEMRNGSAEKKNA
jgi:hypothetical protein